MSDLERYRDRVVQEEVDGITYTSTKFDASTALRLMSRLVLVLGESGLMAVVSAGLSRAALASAAVYPAMIQLAAGLEQDPKLPRDLCASLKCEALRPTGAGGSVGPAFDQHFSGELAHLLNVLGFVVKHNFLGFTLGADWLNGNSTSAETETETRSSSETPSEESTR